MTIKQGAKVVDTIFIHCAATRPDWMEDEPLSKKVAEIARWHKQRGWSGIGYHWIIDRDGAIAEGRVEHVAGSHVAGHNTGSIGICLIGGHGSNESDPFSKHFTPEQEHALRGLIEEIKARTPIKRVRGHNEVAAKACPGFSVPRWLANQPAKRSLSESTTMKASLLGGGSTAVAGATAVSQLHGTAQIVLVVALVVAGLAFAWIMRERIRKWAREVAE